MSKLIYYYLSMSKLLSFVKPCVRPRALRNHISILSNISVFFDTQNIIPLSSSEHTMTTDYGSSLILSNIHCCHIHICSFLYSHPFRFFFYGMDRQNQLKIETKLFDLWTIGYTVNTTLSHQLHTRGLQMPYKCNCISLGDGAPDGGGDDGSFIENSKSSLCHIIKCEKTMAIDGRIDSVYFT